MHHNSPCATLVFISSREGCNTFLPLRRRWFTQCNCSGDHEIAPRLGFRRTSPWKWSAKNFRQCCQSAAQRAGGIRHRLPTSAQPNARLEDILEQAQPSGWRMSDPIFHFESHTKARRQEGGGRIG